MARLTDPLAGQRPVPRQVRSGGDLTPVGPTGALGQGLVSLGESLSQAGNELYRGQMVEEERINTLRAEEAYT